MNPVAEEMRAIIDGETEELFHIGMPRRSGRYPWGSGDDPYQHSEDFLGRIEELKKQGWTETAENIKNEFGMTTSEFRNERSLCVNERRMLNVARAKSLREDGLNDTEIGRQMGVNESTVRSWFNEKSESRMNAAKETAEFLKKRSEECKADGGMIDVGSGVEYELNISREKLNQSLRLLKEEGYGVYAGRVPQVTNPGQFTTQLVLCPPDIKPKNGAKAPAEIYDFDKIHTVKEYITRDGGKTFEKKFHYPESMDSKRLKIRYNEDGGLEKDGIVEIRRGVEDLSLGKSRYAQVRILVDGTHYIKGMAVYSDNMPDGVDVVFNTNKTKGTPMTKVLKEIKSDPDNPFGSAIKDVDQGGQYWYKDKNGKEKLGLINKRADEGDWSDWKDALPSQFLGKQNISMAKKQLKLAKEDKLAEYESYRELTNPTIRKHLLEKFADSCDSAAVHLQAAALPGQKYHVIIPINSLKDTEVYAPKYKDGTKLALVRYPHGGTFEIPILTVNNKHAAAKKLLGSDVEDAVGINKNIADRLSGADFDGDTVMCIPTHNGKVKISNKQPLKGLEGFDPKEKYGPDSYEGKNIRLMTKKGTQTQMGIISNLITDMTLAGANDTELAAAVRHSMVVIDAEKHKLDYKQSEFDNNIAALHKKYQGKATGGAATILSRSKGEKSVVKRQGTPKVNLKGTDWYDPSKPEGSLIYKVADDATYEVQKVNKRTGAVTTKTVTKTQKSTKMAEVDDAYDLVSTARHPMELVYADYANSMKALANQARKEVMTTGKIQYSKAAADTYRAEVVSLGNKLKEASLNTPRERAANRMAAAEIQTKKKANQLEDRSAEKKAAQRAISKYRTAVGSIKRRDRNIDITDREWDAIQAGAVSENVLKKILNNTDVDALRQRATPRAANTLSSSQVARIKNLAASDYTLAEIAAKIGTSPSTVSKYLK